jgi:hypothetical protein
LLNLPLGALSSRSAPSLLDGELFKKFGLFLNTGVCIKHADQPAKQSATPYRLFHVASVEPLWLKMTHSKNIEDALCSITECIV